MRAVPLRGTTRGGAGWRCGLPRAMCPAGAQEAEGTPHHMALWAAMCAVPRRGTRRGAGGSSRGPRGSHARCAPPGHKLGECDAAVFDGKAPKPLTRQIVSGHFRECAARGVRLRGTKRGARHGNQIEGDGSRAGKAYRARRDARGVHVCRG